MHQNSRVSTNTNVDMAFWNLKFNDFDYSSKVTTVYLLELKEGEPKDGIIIFLEL